MAYLQKYGASLNTGVNGQQQISSPYLNKYLNPQPTEKKSSGSFLKKAGTFLKEGLIGGTEKFANTLAKAAAANPTVAKLLFPFQSSGVIKDVQGQQQSEQELVNVTQKLIERASSKKTGDSQRTKLLQEAQKNYQGLSTQNKEYLDSLPTNLQILGQAGETLLDIVTWGAGGAAVKAGVKTAELGVKEVLKLAAKEGLKTGAKIGTGYGLTGGLQAENPTVGSVAASTATGGIIGGAAGLVLQPVMALTGKLLKGVFGKTSKAALDEFSKTDLGKDYYANLLDDPVVISPDNIYKVTAKEIIPNEIKTGDRVFSKEVGGMFRVNGVLAREDGKQVKSFIRLESPSGAVIDVDVDELSKYGFKRINKTLSLPDVKQIKPKDVDTFVEKTISTKETAKLSSSKKVTSFVDALKKADVLRGAQEKARTVERSQRLGAFTGQLEGATTEKEAMGAFGKLKGEYVKVNFEPLRKFFSQGYIDSFIRDIVRSPNLVGYEKATALKQFQEMLEGRVGTDSGAAALSKVFGEELVQELARKQGLIKQALDLGYRIGNVPRSIMSSLDFSGSFRQALVAGARHPIIFARNFPKQFKYFFNEEAFQREVMDEIRNRPSFAIMTDPNLGGVAITDLGGKVGAREEKYASDFADLIPGVRASGRAYTGFLNRMRADIFDSLLHDATKAGLNPAENPKLLREMGRIVNASTGRGELADIIKPASNLLNTVFFSPKLVASRLFFLNPLNYIGRFEKVAETGARRFVPLEPFARKEMLKSVLSLSSMAATVLGIAKSMGAEVETDARSSDFLKVKVGHTRVDILGGFGQYLTLGGRLVTGEYKSSTTGVVTKLSGDYNAQSRYETAFRFLEYKQSPIFSFISTLLKQKPLFADNASLSKEIVNFAGVKTPKDKLVVANEIVNRMLPMVAQDSYDLYHEYGVESLPLSILAILGFGLQTY
jgi:hypothetical protein